MSVVDVEKLCKVAEWVISENARGVQAIPKWITKLAKEAINDTTEVPKYSHRVRSYRKPLLKK